MSMHSVREMMGVDDVSHTVNHFKVWKLCRAKGPSGRVISVHLRTCIMYDMAKRGTPCGKHGAMQGFTFYLSQDVPPDA